MTGHGWLEVADRVLVLRYPLLDVNATLIPGEGAALLVDTLSTRAQAAELAAAVASVTSAPLTLINTHHHFDHCFGNATLAGEPGIWAHFLCREQLRDHAEVVRRAAAKQCPELATELAEVEIRPPDHDVHEGADLDIGGRRVLLRHTGRGHTSNDLAVLIPDAGVTVTGDLVEVGAPPDFGDAWPLEWAPTLAELLVLSEAEGADSVFVPGHGAVTGAYYVRAQHTDLARLEWLCREGHADSATIDEVAGQSPFGLAASRTAVKRAYADLNGTLYA